MHIPKSEGERVRTPEGEGEYTGESGQFDEHFHIELDSGETVRLHYEDIHEA